MKKSMWIASATLGLALVNGTPAFAAPNDPVLTSNWGVNCSSIIVESANQDPSYQIKVETYAQVDGPILATYYAPVNTRWVKTVNRDEVAGWNYTLVNSKGESVGPSTESNFSSACISVKTITVQAHVEDDVLHLAYTRANPDVYVYRVTYADGTVENLSLSTTTHKVTVPGQIKVEIFWAEYNYVAATDSTNYVPAVVTPPVTETPTAPVTTPPVTETPTSPTTTPSSPVATAPPTTSGPTPPDGNTSMPVPPPTTSVPTISVTTSPVPQKPTPVVTTPPATTTTPPIPAVPNKVSMVSLTHQQVQAIGEGKAPMPETPGIIYTLTLDKKTGKWSLHAKPAKGYELIGKDMIDGIPYVTLTIQVDRYSRDSRYLARKVRSYTSDRWLDYREDRAHWRHAKHEFVTVRVPVNRTEAQLVKAVNAKTKIGDIASMGKHVKPGSSDVIVAWRLGKGANPQLPWGSKHNVSQRLIGVGYGR